MTSPIRSTNVRGYGDVDDNSKNAAEWTGAEIGEGAQKPVPCLEAKKAGDAEPNASKRGLWGFIVESIEREKKNSLPIIGRQKAMATFYNSKQQIDEED
jgi:hypothetical protein